MTTGNKIITKTIEDVTYIPLESVQTGPDSIPFVYTKKGNKQIVVLGEDNENNVVIDQGLTEGTVIYLSTPENHNKFKLSGQDLIAVNQERARAKKEEERKAKEEAEKANQQGGFRGMEGIAPGMVPGGSPQMRGNMPQGGAPRDTAAFRKMLQNNPEMRQRLQNMRRDTSARRRNFNQQGQSQNQQNSPAQGPNSNQN
jgi:hypothetical protein